MRLTAALRKVFRIFVEIIYDFAPGCEVLYKYWLFVCLSVCSLHCYMTSTVKSTTKLHCDVIYSAFNAVTR